MYKLTDEQIARIPESEAYNITTKAPKLEGTEKQVKWAMSIRANIYDNLAVYVLRGKNGLNGLWETYAMNGKEEIIKDVERFATAYSEKPNVEKVEERIKSYRILAAKIKKFNEIMENPSASWWIDHRTNQEKNYMNIKLKSEIDKCEELGE